jgi:hypothetical protein
MGAVVQRQIDESAAKHVAATRHRLLSQGFSKQQVTWL